MVFCFLFSVVECLIVFVYPFLRVLSMVSLYVVAMGVDGFVLGLLCLFLYPFVQFSVVLWLSDGVYRFFLHKGVLFPLFIFLHILFSGVWVVLF